MTPIVLQPNTPEELRLIKQLSNTLKIKTLTVKETSEEKRKREFLEGIDWSAEQIKAHLHGEIKLKSARQALDEL